MPDMWSECHNLSVYTVLDPMAWNKMLFSASGIIFVLMHVLFFAVLSQVLSRVMFLTNLSLVLIAPFWPQKEWFVDLLALLIEKPLELPLLWNLLIQPHVRKFTEFWRC